MSEHPVQTGSDNKGNSRNEKIQQQRGFRGASMSETLGCDFLYNVLGSAPRVNGLCPHAGFLHGSQTGSGSLDLSFAYHLIQNQREVFLPSKLYESLTFTLIRPN